MQTVTGHCNSVAGTCTAKNKQWIFIT